jgi:hypothetical protein
MLDGTATARNSRRRATGSAATTKAVWLGVEFSLADKIDQFDPRSYPLNPYSASSVGRPERRLRMRE